MWRWCDCFSPFPFHITTTIYLDAIFDYDFNSHKSYFKLRQLKLCCFSLGLSKYELMVLCLLAFLFVFLFFRREDMEKVNIKFHDNYTVTYQHKKILQFVPELSIDKNLQVITPNIPLLVQYCVRQRNTH